jgi:hypothetical protein
MMHADRTSRALLGLLGLLLLAAGVAGLLAGTDVFGRTVDRRHLNANPVAGFIETNTVWFWPVAAVLGVVVAVLALRWLITVLMPAPRAANIVVPGDRSAGGTTLESRAFSDALTTEVETYRGVRTARAWVDGTPTDPRLNLAVGLDEDADLVALRHRVEAEGLTHARQALDRPDLPIRLEMTVTAHRSSRVG